MNFYLGVKWLHIVSSVVLVGTGFGTAYYMYFTNRTKDLAAQAVVSRLVVQADWWFTAPAAVLQPATGLALVYLGGWSLSAPWLLWAIGLYFFAGLCWLIVLRLQLRMAAQSEQAYRLGLQLPDSYWRYTRQWERLGYPAFAATLVIFYLMVAKSGAA